MVSTANEAKVPSAFFYDNSASSWASHWLSLDGMSGFMIEEMIVHIDDIAKHTAEVHTFHDQLLRKALPRLQRLIQVREYCRLGHRSSTT